MTRIADELKAGYKDGDPRRSAIAWLDGERQPVLAGIALDMLYLAHADNERLRALLTELDAHVAWYFTGTEHEHDAESPFSRSIERHRALDGGAPCATCGGKRLDKSDVTRVLAGKVAVGGGELAAWTACPTCGGSGVAS